MMNAYEEKFAEELRNVACGDDLKAVFEKNGLELEDGLTYDEAYAKMVSAADGELSMDELEQVSGGLVVTITVAGFVITVTGATIAKITAAIIAYWGIKYVKGALRGLRGK